MKHNEQHMTLGQLIDTLERHPPDNILSIEPLGLIPSYLDSYRGDYCDLSIGFTDDMEPRVLVVEFLPKLKAAVGAIFTGYKGGEYVMSADTPIWIAQYGKCGLPVTSVEQLSNYSFILFMDGES